MALVAGLAACGGQATSATPPVTTIALTTASASASASAPVIAPLAHASASARPADPPVPHLEHCVLHAGGGESHSSTVKVPTVRVPGQPAPTTKPVVTSTRTDRCWFNAECGVPGQVNEGDGDASIRCTNDDCECVVETRPAQGEPVRFSFTEAGACRVPHGVQTLLIDRCMAGSSVANDPRKEP